jgi:transcriptional regulator with XRE-family HTH domain
VGPKASALGDYLRARREQVRPEEVDLAAGARRRLPGLRREELATLAGISSAYYLRLGHGRDTRPSAQVVDALADALRLDVKATEYLHRLASAPGSRRPQPDGETVANGLDELIDQFHAGNCGQQMPGRAGRESLRPGATIVLP